MYLKGIMENYNLTNYICKGKIFDQARAHGLKSKYIFLYYLC